MAAITGEVPLAEMQTYMADLRSILAGRSAFYAKAEWQLDTSAQAQEETFLLLRDKVRTLLQPIQAT